MHFVTNLFTGVQIYQNRLRFARVIDKSLLPHFFIPHSVYLFFIHINLTQNMHMKIVSTSTIQ